MIYTSNSMQAYAIDLHTIKVVIHREYYAGKVKQFYICQDSTMDPLRITRIEETESIAYYLPYEIDITKIYTILSEQGLRVTLQYVPLISMVGFDSQFYYEKKDLGATYTKEETTWKVWAPTALTMHLQLPNKGLAYAMQKDRQGVFTIALKGDYEKESYLFLVEHGSGSKTALDPYSYSTMANGDASVVVSLENCQRDTTIPVAPMSKKSDAIIYELSVRDFTEDSKIGCLHPATYLGLVETGLQTPKGNPAGLDYLLQLGITHVQLMPIQDFATTDENCPPMLYNWGYDPLQYSVPEGAYCSDVEDPYVRIKECQQMIEQLHKAGLRVVIDVVYNHMYDAAQTAYETLVPEYFFRRYENGGWSNTSWCGNDVNTSRRMVQKYLVDISSRWQDFYGVDGIRFDLMGLLDISLLQQIHKVTTVKDSTFLLYGEGWNMEGMLPYEHRSIQENHQKIPEIGFFNDHFRDKLKGNSNEDGIYDKGYFAGNMYNTYELLNSLQNLRYSEVSQSINYVECHDNHTVFDKYAVSNQDESENLRKRRQKLLTSIVLLAQGIPFIHSGQECYRTKLGRGNTYNHNDGINLFNWALVDDNWKDIQDIQNVISIRKKYPEFWYDTNKEVAENTEVIMHNHEYVIYRIKGLHPLYWSITMYINGSMNSYDLAIDPSDDVLYSISDDPIINTLPALSLVVIGNRKL